ncbi:MAG TPA: polysaccharide deacetylase family protein [Actinomycetes bacterium]|nr:polysaccharide deacetylase family protein [Actinomycetes bacterium]
MLVVRPRPRYLGAALLATASVLAGCSDNGTRGAAPATTRPTTSTAQATSSATPATSPPIATSAPPSSPAGPTGSPATCRIPTDLRGQDLERIPTSRKVVALTFDAGANADGVSSILQMLAAKDVPGTFFLTGRFVEDFPTESGRIGARYVVGNHTMTHPDLTTLSDSRVRAEIAEAERAIRIGIGQDPRRYFRFPFGARDERTLRIVNSRCYVAFRWTVDTLGWRGTSGGMSVAKVVDRVLDAATAGEIVLMHVGSHPDDHSTLDADALPQIIDGLRARGYRFVTLTEVLGSDPD